jgi:gamma-glutamylcyclotransferase (GGCT)/AIG2-like uncharacterized protein YtfP
VSLFHQAGFVADTKYVPRIQRPQDKYFVADMFSRTMDIGNLRGVALDVSTVHDFHGSADNPTLNGTLRHQDLDLALYQRAQVKVDKYREGYAAPGLRHAFLPAIVSTSGRIHGELLRLLFNLADKKTSNSLEALGEAIDVESEAYCRRRNGNFDSNFWRMRAALGLACAQAATLGTQVVGRPRSRPRCAARPRH